MTSDATTLLRYARKQAKAFGGGRPGSQPCCQGCMLDNKRWPGTCNRACMVIDQAQRERRRRLRAARGEATEVSE